MAKRVRRAGSGAGVVVRPKRDDAADADVEIVRANVERENFAEPGFVSLYVNDTQVQISPWDVRMIFGEIADPATKERPTVRVKSLGEVRMSPQHAKRLVKILARLLVGYEKRFGVIPQPPD